MRNPSPFRRNRARPLPCTAPSPRVLRFLARISPLRTSSSSDTYTSLPSDVPASSSVDDVRSPRSSTSSASSLSWRKPSLDSPRRPVENDVTALLTSLNPLDSLRVLRRRRWRWMDAWQAVLVGVFLFSLWVAPSAPLLKTAVVSSVIMLLLVPVTGQFFLPSMPIWTYLLYFFCSRFIPYEWRPPVSVTVLPSLENILFGTSLSHVLSAHTHPVLDLLAWFPYGITHFGAPAVCSLAFFLFAAPGTAPTYARAFGWMSVLGVTMQILLPTTPPWYEDLHGLDEPARYGMGGSPAGLARIDALFGVDMYTTNFETNPIPFGAFPSLHGGNAVLQALFVGYCFPRLRIPAFLYVCWIWWATMYLGHHYAVDLVGGGLVALVFFLVVYRFWLPRARTDKPTRWDYDRVDLGSRRLVPDPERQREGEERPGQIGLKELRRASGASDVGSTSSFWSRSSRPASSGSGSRSGSISGSSSSGGGSPRFEDTWSHPSKPQSGSLQRGSHELRGVIVA